jgi:hypothetical protein
MKLTRLRLAVVTVATVVVCVPAQPAAAGEDSLIGATGSLKLRYAGAIALGAAGRVYVLDSGGRGEDPTVRLNVYSSSGKVLDSWHVDVTGPVNDLAVDGAENVYVAAQGSRTILKYSSAGRLLAKLHLPGSDDIVGVHIAVDLANRLIVAEGYGRIVVFDTNEQIVAERQVIAPNGLWAIAVTGSGTVYVSDYRGINVLDIAAGALRQITRAGSRPQDVHPFALAAGPADTFYVVNVSAPVPRIQRFAADGSYLGSIGLDRHYQWAGVAVANDGRIFATRWSSGIGDGAVQRFAPIAGIDITAPTVNIRSLVTRPAGRSSRAVARLRYTLSETASVRLAFARREEHGRYAGRYRHMETIDVPPATTGTHTFDWNAPTAQVARRRRGHYKVFVVASDLAGLESSTERATFALTRR